jgi:hypothetical protein
MPAAAAASTHRAYYVCKASRRCVQSVSLVRSSKQDQRERYRTTQRQADSQADGQAQQQHPALQDWELTCIESWPGFRMQRKGFLRLATAAAHAVNF